MKSTSLSSSFRWFAAIKGQIIHKLNKNIRQEDTNKVISLVGLVRKVSGQKISVVEDDFTGSSNIPLHKMSFRLYNLGKVHNLYK